MNKSRSLTPDPDRPDGPRRLPQLNRRARRIERRSHGPRQRQAPPGDLVQQGGRPAHGHAQALGGPHHLDAHGDHQPRRRHP